MHEENNMLQNQGGLSQATKQHCRWYRHTHGISAHSVSDQKEGSPAQLVQGKTLTSASVWKNCGRHRSALLVQDIICGSSIPLETMEELDSL